jgi:2-deoxy-D-gluconate 3-dehydrogenase
MILDSFSLHGKNALVTGSRRGLGAAISVALAEAGANVMIHGSRSDRLEAVCEMVRSKGRKSAAFACDLSQPDSAAKLIEATQESLGSINILINNAGTIRRAPAENFSAEDWTQVIDTNLNAVFRLCQLAGRKMLAHGSGKIVNMASMLSFQGGICVPSYSAAKGAVVQLTKALANEWASRGVNVNAIAPGYMATDNTEALRADPVRSRQILDRIPAGRWGTPADLAGAAVFLSSAASDYLHGHTLVVDGGWLSR